MKFFRQISLVILCVALPLVFVNAEDASNELITKQQPPDFSPPTDLKGPVFPPEEFITPPDEKESNRFLVEFISTMATLGLIISLILIVGWFLKRLVNTRIEQANDTSGIKIVERRMISPKTAIYAIEVEGKGIIIAETASGVTHLTDYAIELSSNQQSSAKIPSTFNKLIDTK